MSGDIPEGSGKQFGEDVAEVEEHQDPDRIPEGSGKEFAEGQADVDRHQSGREPLGSGKQFAPDHEGDPAEDDLPESGKGFAHGQDDG